MFLDAGCQRITGSVRIKVFLLQNNCPGNKKGGGLKTRRL